MEIKNPKFINITGNIGSGATTLCQKLCEYFDWQPSYSRAHASPYLEEFYQRRNSAFHNQLYIIIQSMKQQMRLDSIASKARTICQDYVIHEHNCVYSRNMLDLGQISSNELALLEDVFKMLSKPYGRKPDLLIYMACNDTNILLQRIAKRARSNERNIDKSYLDRLQKYFDEFAKSWNLSPIIEVDTTKFNVFSYEEVSTLRKKIEDVL